MENALWNGELVLAYEIAENYTLEKEIRKSSGTKNLCCPDDECQSPVLRYCHGEIKNAFFAHLNNTSCDYAIFDKDNTEVMRTVRRTICENFKNKEYDVQAEVKVLPHHYTHLLFEMEDGSKTAVEIGTQRITANKIDNLTDEYAKEGIMVKWIVLGDTNTQVRENQTFFLKRYLLNESANKDLLVINYDCSIVAQYKSDPTKYSYNGRYITSENYPETYIEYSTLDSLVFENNELSLQGYHTRYQEWLKKKQSAFNKKIKQLEEESHKAMEEIRRQAQEKNRIYRERQAQLAKAQNFSIKRAPDVTAKVENPPKPNMSYEERKKEILLLISQQANQARDSTGHRWVKCELCGCIETEDKFCSYGGMNRVNLGVCYSCSRKR